MPFPAKRLKTFMLHFVLNSPYNLCQTRTAGLEVKSEKAC